MTSSPDRLSRYDSGQRDQVWHELRALGSRADWLRQRHAPEVAHVGGRRSAGDRAGGARLPGEPMREHVEEEWAEWLDRRTDDPGTAGLLELPFAPDRPHKDNTSGFRLAGDMVPL